MGYFFDKKCSNPPCPFSNHIRFCFFCIDQIIDLSLGGNYGKIMKIKLEVSVLRWNLNNLSRGLNPPNPGLNSAPA